jgi:hypothetical protein
MANTANFGWETPDDTDLVKDGAAAMRTLGSAIDTSMMDLKGGTSGQNLRKNSNTDMDFTWAGDATNTVIDAEGDLLVGDSADTLQRLAIGTTGQVLTADTTVDGKIKWATLSSSSGPTFNAYMTNGGTDQTPSNLTFTKIIMDTEQVDTDNCYDTTNRRFTPNKAGYYLFTFVIATTASPTTGRRDIAIFKNGSEITTPYARFSVRGISETDGFISGSNVIYANGTTDYFELFITFSASTSRSVYTNSNGASTMWTGTFLRS